MGYLESDSVTKAKLALFLGYTPLTTWYPIPPPDSAESPPARRDSPDGAPWTWTSQPPEQWSE
jgi:hypothetical protein